MTAGAQCHSIAADDDPKADQIQRLETRIRDLEAALHSAPVEVEPGQIALGDLLRAKDETIAAKAEVVERQKELIELWKRKYHENWCAIL